MTPAQFERRLARYAACYDGNAWRVAEFALAVKDSEPAIPGWAKTFAQAFERGRRWAQMLARVAEMAAEYPTLRRMTYAKADLVARYLLRDGIDYDRLFEMLAEFSAEPHAWTYERIRAELADAFGAVDDGPDALPRRWARWSADLYSHAERLAVTDPRRSVVEQAAALLAGIGKAE